MPSSPILQAAAALPSVSSGGDACTVEDECLIGMGAVVLNNTKIGEGSIIAAGTVIPEGTVIEPYSLWMGVPGKFKKRIDDEATQQTILQYGKNYVDYTEEYRKELGL